MDTAPTRIAQLESTVHALEELLTTSESAFLEESRKLELANDELKKENTYRRFFELSAEAMLTLCDGYFVDCNESCVRMLRAKNKEEVLQTHPWELSPPYQPDGRASEEKAHEMIGIAEQKGTHCFEWCHRRMDGEDFPVEVSLTAITIGGKKVFNSAWRDITDRKAAEKEVDNYHKHLEELVELKTREIAAELKKHEQLEHDIRQILDASGDAIRVIDCDFNIIYANEALEQIKNAAPGSLIGKKCYEATPENVCHTENCTLKRALKHGKGFSKEEYIDVEKDKQIPFLVRFSPYTDSNGKTIGLIKSYRNILEEKQNQQAAEENALQQGRIEMSNNMLHDIGNAMTGISAYILKPQVEKQWPEIKSLHQLRDLFAARKQELIQVLGNEKQQALDNFIDALIASFEKRNTDHIAFFEKVSSAIGHVCDVLDLQRHYMREHATPLATEINLVTIINDTLVMLAGSLEKRNIKVELKTTHRNLIISGDQTRLIRVFLNIIKNIYEAFDEVETKDDRKLAISIVSEEEKKEIRVLFQDNGIGFDPETGENLFTRGFTTKPNGSGIGLHECRSIIESHNGTMTMQSDGRNTGALTAITFPFSNNKKG